MRTALLFVLAGITSNAQDATLTGTVVDALTHQPVEGARVGLLRGFQKTVTTDVHGRFQIVGVPAGRHSLRLTKTGYVDSNYGEPFGAETAEATTLRLTPAASVEGVLVGEDDRPLAGCHVYAGNFSAETDTTGRFRLEHLRPGVYQLRFLLPSSVVRQHVRVDPETKDRFGYPPSVEDPLGVTLGAGSRVEGHRVRLRRQLLVELSGRLIDESTREPLVGGEVELSLAGGNFYADESLRRRAAGAGRFRFDLLPPGAHTLYVYRGGVSGGIPYALPIDLGRKGLVDARFRVPGFHTVRVRIVFEKEKRPEPAGLQLRLSAGGASQENEPNAEGIVEFHDVPPGERYRFSSLWSGRVSMPGGAVLTRNMLGAGPPRWYLKQIAVNGRTVREHEFFPLNGAAEIEILVSDARGVAVFEAVDDNGKPVPGASIWTRSSVSQFVPANASVDFPEGNLEAVAVPDGASFEQAAQCPDRRKVAITAGAEQRVRLTVCRVN